jgi:hypothetical protein
VVRIVLFLFCIIFYSIRRKKKNTITELQITFGEKKDMLLLHGNIDSLKGTIISANICQLEVKLI